MTTDARVLIEVQGLTKKFGDNLVLDGITTDIRQGEVVVVIGPSGSGKSTFLRSLNLLEVPTGGKIFFEGEDITDPKVDINRHRQKIGMVFQQFNLFPHKTVKENIMLAPVTLKLMSEEQASARAEELLKRVGLPDKADAEMVGEVLEIMRDLAETGMTMVVVTLEMGFAREVGSRVMFIDGGKIQEENAPQAFFSNPKNPRLREFLSKVL